MTAATTTTAFSYEDFRNNFPFETISPKQYDVLKKICDAFNSGFNVVVLEAPTGFGKSPVAIAVARTLGSSYFCSATKELQTQYVKDFPLLRAVKGMSNYSCLVKEDFIENETYACGKCGTLDRKTGKKITNACECKHKVVEYGPCRSGHIGYQHDSKSCGLCNEGPGYNSVNSTKFHNGCRYRTYQEDYVLEYPNTDYEQIEINELRREQYQASLQNTNKNTDEFWMHTSSFEDFDKIRRDFASCPYYDQLNKGIIASHSIFNYANFLIFLRLKNDPLPQKELLVLDEGHSIENQIAEQVGISISKKMLQRYVATDIFEDISYDNDYSIERNCLKYSCQDMPGIGGCYRKYHVRRDKSECKKLFAKN